jgi:DDE superfamily endonuclease
VGPNQTVTTTRHTHAEFLSFLKQVAQAYPRVKLHIVCDNYGTHKHPRVKAWLTKNPRITMHYTPTSGSRLNLVVRHEVARVQ